MFDGPFVPVQAISAFARLHRQAAEHLRNGMPFSDCILQLQDRLASEFSGPMIDEHIADLTIPLQFDAAIADPSFVEDAAKDLDALAASFDAMTDGHTAAGGTLGAFWGEAKS